MSGKLNVKKIIASFEESPALLVMSAFFMIVVGGLLVNSHNIWVKDWTVLVTITAWAILIKGIVFLASPQLMYAFKGFSKKVNIQYGGLLVIDMGLLFGYFGFVA